MPKIIKFDQCSWSYSQNNTGTVFLRHGVVAAEVTIEADN